MDSQKKIYRTGKYIEQFVDAGYVIIPLQGKVPPKNFTQWQKIAYEPFVDPADYPANYGVVLKDDDLVIDIDPRNFQGSDSWKQFLTDHKLTVLPSTLIVQTGGGGWHFYFKKNKDIKVVSSLKKYPGIEFRSANKYVVGPGSIHPDTNKTYDVLQGNASAVASLPEVFYSILEKPDPLKAAGTGKYQDDLQTQDRYKEYLLAVDPAVEGEGGDMHTFRMAAAGKDYGLSPTVTFELMMRHFNPRCDPPWDAAELQLKVRNAYSYAQNEVGTKSPAAVFDKLPQLPKIRWDLHKKSQEPLKTLRNCINYFIDDEFKLYKLLAFNEFTGDIHFTRPAPWHKMNKLPEKGLVWSDEDAINCKFFITQNKHIEFSINVIHEAIVVVAGYNRFHPVRDYLDKLRWDGVSRIDTWLTDYCGVMDSKYSQTVAAKTLIAAVARIYIPGCKFDHMLVLEGKQDIGKSTVCRVLGGEWYGDIHIDVKNKDTIDAMRGKWIIEVSEMVCTFRSETQALKAFLSRQTDRVRLAYAKNSKDFHRQNIFIGTTNPEAENEYLKDTTGNRRYWPVATTRINLDALTAARDQLWAEALHRFNKQEVLYINDDEIKEMAMAEQKLRSMKDPWSEKIRQYLDLDEYETARTQVTGMEIYEQCLGGQIRQFTRKEMIRISNIMQNELGWVKGQFYDNNLKRTVNGYRLDSSNSDGDIRDIDDLGDL